uniref:Cns1/TTC4 wheel domain-containing protein n=1 Tax=Chromera velia CCMP2878 TaxID=1169474 RepID=A0A0G4FNK9_9ALVE|mmetsp:Transcript_5662/g.11242  ORF Transcript_5662/g.11242 Transcript_5662/m.11242 type:complete len:383 (-) Transcript_5662:67-1215(-)|eukprot:Cvel_3545.t1-p1 / transcript=Cvel_3545.t1 / gene=Cvel_3545 / organism=Chromera_velia_CCMP2878 / gene_product=Tetratricopeptide repeat protein 4 homolog, putative / transcript_product=Tetratricopeptide repeat protein 4 homolog, putative / location=Cvel_scaffold144:101879-104475(+) / protein_length=382 / sequence_SO=supercontig / SO=protein_coding / is_pseudo=false
MENLQTTLAPKAEITTGVSELDDFFDFDLTEEQLAKLNEKYGDKEHPLFMDELPTNLEDYPELEALQQLIYAEGETPDSIAANFKQHGNEFVKEGPKKYREALHCYTQALDQPTTDTKLRSVLHSNRAHVRLHLKNYPGAVDDARHAIRSDVSNVKAYWRGAKASTELGLYKQVIGFCDAGLKQDGENAELKKLKAQAAERLEEAEVQKEKVAQAEKVEEKKKETTQEKVARTFKERGIQVEAPLYDMGARYSGKASVDLMGRLKMPVAFLYDESLQSDFIEEFGEEDLIEEHLQTMFPGDRFVEWDSEKKYVWDKLAVYFEPGGPETGLMVRVSRDWSLKQVLFKRKRTAHIPVFHILVENSPAHRAFLEANHCEDAIRKK